MDGQQGDYSHGRKKAVAASAESSHRANDEKLLTTAKERRIIKQYTSNIKTGDDRKSSFPNPYREPSDGARRRKKDARKSSVSRAAEKG